MFFLVLTKKMMFHVTINSITKVNKAFKNMETLRYKSVRNEAPYLNRVHQSGL